MKSGLVISDLHLFSPRSEGFERMTALWEEVTRAEVLVLNGDIFDFRWTCLPDETATLKAALEWLNRLMDEFEGSAIHYVLGNHDCLSAFSSSLAELSLQRPVLSCHEHRLLLNRKLFLHGDCANRNMDEPAFIRYRKSWLHHRRQGNIPRALYQVADVSGLSLRFHQCHFPQAATVSRVAHHLDHILPAWREEIDDCYFGHTHRPFSDHSHEGVRFHNTGSGIRGMGFLPMGFGV